MENRNTIAIQNRVNAMGDSNYGVFNGALSNESLNPRISLVVQAACRFVYGVIRKRYKRVAFRPWLKSSNF